LLAQHKRAAGAVVAKTIKRLTKEMAAIDAKIKKQQSQIEKLASQDTKLRERRRKLLFERERLAQARL
jgi:hypothetical protein